MRTFSYGGGVQSTAALVLAVQGKIDYRTFLFANVGDDSENPATMTYLYEHAGPYAERHGIALHVLDRRTRDGKIETLYGRLTKEGSKSLPIPVRMSNTGAPGRRSCTADFKIKVVAKWQREHGASASNPATCGIGISLDELGRARSDSGFPYQILDYPLLALRLTRQDCLQVIKAAGLPKPPKSSCYFCPMHTVGAWQEQRDNEPELFGSSVALERLLNARRAALGKDPVYFSSRLVPLDRATSEHRQLPMVSGDDQEEVWSCGPFGCNT